MSPWCKHPGRGEGEGEEEEEGRHLAEKHLWIMERRVLALMKQHEQWRWVQIFGASVYLNGDWFDPPREEVRLHKGAPPPIEGAPIAILPKPKP
jgi:hypothetical protein